MTLDLHRLIQQLSAHTNEEAGEQTKGQILREKGEQLRPLSQSHSDLFDNYYQISF